MKKILFIIPEYSHGGTNKSLENLLFLLDKEQYDISIYSLYEDGGDYYKKEFAPYVLKKSQLYYWLHDNFITRKLLGLYNKLTKRDNFAFLYKKEAKLLEKNYDFDVAIAYQEGTATQFVSYFTKTRKIAWIHCDYGAWTGGHRRLADNCYLLFSDVVCVSESARLSFCSLFPEMQSKTHAIYNTLADIEIKAKSIVYKTVTDYKNSYFNIVSIGRLSAVKQFDLIPRIVHQLRTNSIRWYIIGEGDSESVIRNEVDKYGLQDVVILLGSKNNPYPYIRLADLLVCTSSSESFSYVIAEAKVLHTPVLSNDFPVAYEVIDEAMGWIANINHMHIVLTRIINNIDGEYVRKKDACLNFNYSNNQILQQINHLILD